MQDLRARLGIILALAMLPLLVFSVWRSVLDFTRDQDLLRANTDLTARIALTETVNSFETTRSILRLTSVFLEDGNCGADMAKLTDAYPRLYNIIYADGSGAVKCSTKPVRANALQTEALLSQLSEESPYASLISSLPSQTGAPERVVATAYAKFDQGKIEHIFVAVESITFLEGLLEKSKILEQSELAIFDRNGAVLGGDWRGGDLKSVALALPEQQFEERLATQDDAGRALLVLPTPAIGIYLAVATEGAAKFSRNKLKPLFNAAIPLFAWLFGFAAIWLSTDQLILTHIRRMRRATLKFARGDRSARVGTLTNPPASIYALGKNFDEMADRIIERETTIGDALDEKETLLREIHHRVKNNLQIIISLLNMQERKLEDEEGLAAIVETRSRINAIALVHKGLYESRDLRFVDMQRFLDRLLPQLALAFGSKDNGITISGRASCDPMEADTATPVALFIVEALTNSVKHGVGSGGAVIVNIMQTDGNVTVSVTDNGSAGLKKTVSTGGIGQKLMTGFARQLGGKLERESGVDGYEVSLKFSPREHSDIGFNPSK